MIELLRDNLGRVLGAVSSVAFLASVAVGTESFAAFLFSTSCVGVVWLLCMKYNEGGGKVTW